MLRRKRALLVAMGLALTGSMSVAQAQSQAQNQAQSAVQSTTPNTTSNTTPGQTNTEPYPARPIRLIVGFPAGGASDVAARAIAGRMAELLGQPVVVENKPGAAGNIGSESVAKSKPDGYTLLFGTISSSINGSLYKNLTYDPVKDFAAISQVTSTPFLLVVNPASPYRSVKDIIDAARSAGSAQKLPDYATAGNGSGSHLFMELFTSMAGIKLSHVPYRGAAPAIADVMGGQVPIIFDNILTTLAQVESGKLRALAVSTKNRSSVAPDVPTLSEAGVPGYDATAWFGLFAPAKTPESVINKISDAAKKALLTESVRSVLLKAGAEPVGSSPIEFDSFYRAEVAKWAKVIANANVHVD